MGLRVEEQFDMFDILRVGTCQVVHGQVAEVMLCLENFEIGIVDG